MELPDCPPGAEGYQDSVVEVPKKPDDTQCTKAELEFQEHLLSLKIKLENNETRCMVERRERSISGKWTYLCFPCAAVCSGESVLQTHLSGKKHKAKLATRNVWPLSIFDDHPFNHMQKPAPPVQKEQGKGAGWKIQMVDATDPNFRYNQFLLEKCHIQDSIDDIKAPLIGLEYLVENPPEQEHYEPTYLCTLCTKQGHPRTIINHMTCFWHRYNYLHRHFPKACNRLNPYKNQPMYRESVSVMLHRLCQRIEDKFGRLKPINIEKELFEREKDEILKWIFKGVHFIEKEGCTFEEVVDVDLMESLKSDETKTSLKPTVSSNSKKDPSPPKVAAPSRPHIRGRNERRVSISSLSDISDDDVKRPHLDGRDKYQHDPSKVSFEPFAEQPTSFRSRYAIRNVQPDDKKEDKSSNSRPPNYEYKVKLIDERCKVIEDSAKKMLAYHEKNPEKHPLYPDEWKKFWNRRYKEIQAEGKDPSKHDFKPEWIAFWTKRMKELHEEELRVQVLEIYRKMNVSPPDFNKPKLDKVRDRDMRSDKDSGRSRDRDRRDARRSPERRRRTPERRSDRRRSPERRRSPDLRRRSPDRKRDSRKPSEDYRKRPSPALRRRSPEMEIRSYRRSRSPPRKRTKSRSPRPSSKLHLSPERPISVDRRRSRSPLSRRAAELPLRNRSPVPPHVAPSMQTVLVSDDELKPDDNLSPWNSDNEIMSVGSRSESVRGRMRPTAPPAYRPASPEQNEADHVIATLRTLVALEDYLGSLGPKIVDLLTEAITMEKDRANSSEELLDRESAVVLIETAKEKLKGAAQAALVAPGAVHAVRAAVLRAAATLHEADMRAKKFTKKTPPVAPVGRGSSQPLPVAGVGSVDRALIARQMAAALIAQGKTDVTSEELAQLVDAVVGMAEAKKREAEATQKKAAVSRSTKSSETTSALQLLQSAYDETEKKIDKEEPTDAMDGLSDSDLETLLKNFNELSAEEQHSLIAYLKKLEARDPQRVEKLRQYVSAAASSAPKVEEPPPPSAPPAVTSDRGVKPVTIDSDDDDYTVDEVFKSATEKVKENQIRQEMEIVKKSLEENKVETKSTPPPDLGKMVDLSKNLSSATDLLALVQASMASKVTNSVPSAAKDVVASASGTQPRSFGDMPEPLAPSESHPAAAAHLLNTATPDQDPPQNVHFNGNFQNEQFKQGDTYQNAPFNQAQSYNRNESYNQNESYNNSYDQNNTYNQGNFNKQNEPISQGGYRNQNESLNQGGYSNQNEPINQGGYRNQNEPINQGGYSNQNEPLNQGGYSNQNEPHNQGGYSNQNEPLNQGNYSNQNEPFNQGGYNNQNEPFNQGGINNQNEPFNQGGYNNQNEPFNQGGFNQNAPFSQGNNFNQNMPFNQSDNYNQPWNSRPFNNMPDNRGTGMGPGFNNFNQFGSRDNFRMQDNFNSKPMDMNIQNRNFRGRGNRGGPRGNNRGRGRGRF